MIIPTPRARKLRDVHEGFPGSHSQSVVSDPRICPHSHFAMLLPMVPTQPLLHCQTLLWSNLRSLGALCFEGTGTPSLTVATWNYFLSHGWWG